MALRNSTWKQVIVRRKLLLGQTGIMAIMGHLRGLLPAFRSVYLLHPEETGESNTISQLAVDSWQLAIF
jgi:hypothetical protein